MIISQTQPRLSLENVNTGYGEKIIFQDLSLKITPDKVTTLIGPNGCGKSTALKTMCDLLPYTGHIHLSGKSLKQYSRRERAQALTMLPQNPIAPEGITVWQLVSRGRHPYQSWIGHASTTDRNVVEQAMRVTGVLEFADRSLHTLSGGQRQRVWIAMTLAQDTPTMLLDEPTTYLDLSHSVEVLKIVRDLCKNRGKTIVMVIHDLNLAARFSDYIVAIGDNGTVAAVGDPSEVLTSELLREVFHLEAAVTTDPYSNSPLIIPLID